jgi:formylglycine-generating enzyme required for sulfatase activity
VATHFNAEYLAVVNVTKTEGDYLLSLKVLNIIDNVVVMAPTASCDQCRPSQVMAKLKLLAGGGKSAGGGEVPAESPAQGTQGGVGFTSPSTTPSAGGEAKVERVTPKVSGGSGMKVSMLIVDSIPAGADIYLGDLMVGQTPFQKDLQPDQLVRVTLKKDMYHDKVLELTLKPGVNDVPAVTLEPAFGSVLIESEPIGAEVYIGGKKMGQTPYKSSAVKSGKLLVGLKKELYAPVDNEVLVVADGKETRKKYTLGASFGELQVDSDPSGATVEVLSAKGASAGNGQTPYGVKLEPGKYSVHVTKSGHTSQTFNVEVATGKKAVIARQEAALHHLEGVVIVTSAPLDRSAEVYVDGNKNGNVPATLTLSEGTHEITVKTGDGTKGGSQKLAVKDGESETVRIELKQLAPAKKAEEKAHEGMVYVKKGWGGFWIEKYLVTQEAYQRVTGQSPSEFKNCPACPVETVNWDEATSYCSKVGKSLPKEEDWEYAATSGGKSEKWAGTSTESELGDYAWYEKNSGHKTHPVGEKKPNGLGLYDMSGNVWEWTDSWYDSSRKDRVLRGGSWFFNALDLRAAIRLYLAPDARLNNLGFRCAQY